MRINDKTVGINGLKADGNLSCVFYLENSGIMARSIQAVLAIYEQDGRLVQIVTKNKTVNPGAEEELELSHSFAGYGDNIYTKLLLWDAFQNIIPLTAEITVLVTFTFMTPIIVCCRYKKQMEKKFILGMIEMEI